MTIDEAIEILQDFGWGDKPYRASDLPDSIRLGKEALKWFQEYRSSHPDITFKLLPGETKD